jgi:hypothetical protein
MVLQFWDRIDGWWNQDSSIARLLEGEPWSAKSNSNTKSKSPLKGKPGGFNGAHAIRVPKNSLTPPTSS